MQNNLVFLKKPWFYLVVIVLILLGSVLLNRRQAEAPLDSGQQSKSATQQGTDQQAGKNPAPGFDKSRYSIDDPSSIWVVANKRRPLNPKTFVPDVGTPNVPLRLSADNGEMHLSKSAIPDFEAMFAAAKQDGLDLMLASGYRSYNLQVSVYNAEVKNYGQAQADRESARPGTSEHQTGLAADVEPTSRKCEIADCFGDLPEGKWIAANAYKYGFILRYTPDKEAVTGYRHEAWHIRYVGKELAAEMRNKVVETLEEFFGLPAAPNYQ